MDNQASPYPLLLIEVDFTCTTQSVPLYVLASARTFGILVPLSTIPDIIRTKKRKDPHQVLFSEIVDAFSDIVAEYVEVAEEQDCELPIPDAERLGREFSGEFLQLTGNLEALRSDSSEVEKLVFDDEYFFIAETGVDIYEFLSEHAQTVSGLTLH